MDLVLLLLFLHQAVKALLTVPLNLSLPIEREVVLQLSLRLGIHSEWV